MYRAEILATLQFNDGTLKADDLGGPPLICNGNYFYAYQRLRELKGTTVKRFKTNMEGLEKLLPDFKDARIKLWTPLILDWERTVHSCTDPNIQVYRGIAAIEWKRPREVSVSLEQYLNPDVAEIQRVFISDMVVQNKFTFDSDDIVGALKGKMQITPDLTMSVGGTFVSSTPVRYGDPEAVYIVNNLELHLLMFSLPVSIPDFVP